MNALGIALRVELRKATASRVFGGIAALVVLGVGVLAVALAGATRAGNQQIVTKLGPLASERGWDLLTGVAAQVTAAGGLLAFGVALAWSFGREFAEGTVAGLFALPVSRATIATAKILVHLLWVLLVAAVLGILILLAGVLLGLGPVDGGVLDAIVRQVLLVLLTGLLTVPAAWVATIGRGLLPGIAITVAILVAAQVSAIAVPDVAGWIPVAAPALWALGLGAVRPGQLALVVVLAIVAGALTALAWKRLQLDR